MGRTDPRSRKRDRPEGVTHGFQFSLNSVEPSLCTFARNLFSKDDWRAALFNEAVEFWPQVALVGSAELFSSCRKWLAGAAPRPHGSSGRPPGTPESERPTTNASEEMTLGEFA